ncbi:MULTISPECIES: O-antigen ligase family protein [unclassified Sphingomonas]|uniref:O-antigen ligase family protein n=1 Tax=unclassified Sphingomonas TaxID=196159 RepID=UPI00082D7F20|nr:MULTISPECIES: O-antigen ligase family protein [unclassified Sphingomonas]
MARDRVPARTAEDWIRVLTVELAEIDENAVRGGRIGTETWLFWSFLLVIALLGGASRADSLAQPVVRCVSVVVIGLFVLLIPPARPGLPRLPAIFLALIAALIVAQLVPLPPMIWTALPGRDLAEQAATVAQFDQPWRPFALSPDRAANALFALLPAAATLIGLQFLSRQRIANLVTPVMFLVLASAVLGLAQVSSGEDSPLRWYAVTNREAAVGLLANRNHQALLLGCGLPLVALWATPRGMAADRTRLRALLGAGAAAFLIVMVPVTGSRAGLVVSTIGLLAAIVLVLPRLGTLLRGMRRRTRRLVAGGVALGAVAIVALALTIGRAASVQRLFALSVDDDLRLRAWPTLLEIARDYAPFGAGLGAFEPLYRHYEPFDLLSTSYLNEAHNDYLQVLIEAGVPGVAMIVAFIAWWLIRSIRVWRMAPDTAFIRPARAGSAILLMVLLASAVDYPARTPIIMVVTAIGAIWMLLPVPGVTAVTARRTRTDNALPVHAG